MQLLLLSIIIALLSVRAKAYNIWDKQEAQVDEAASVPVGKCSTAVKAMQVHLHHSHEQL